MCLELSRMGNYNYGQMSSKDHPNEAFGTYSLGFVIPFAEMIIAKDY